jgi:hypothetical protein
MTYPMPHEKDLRQACDCAEDLNYRLVQAFQREDDMDAQYAAACAALQDVADCMGWDIVRQKSPPPATAEAYGIADYAAGRGQL